MDDNNRNSSNNDMTNYTDIAADISENSVSNTAEAELPLTNYKLIILYMLDRVEFPLTKSQIANFLLEKDYISYKNLARVFSELEEAEFIRIHVHHKRTHITLTKDGEDALHYFDDRIDSFIKKDIKQYLQDNKLRFREEVSIISNYQKTGADQYEARLLLREAGENLMDIRISVPTEDIASKICDNWQEHNQDVYRTLMEKLF